MLKLGVVICVKTHKFARILYKFSTGFCFNLAKKMNLSHKLEHMNLVKLFRVPNEA
jgi:hypothetical protein